MNNERYNQIIDEAWNNYLQQTMFDSNPKWLEPVPVMNMETGEKSMGARQYHKNDFLAKCKTDSEFSEKWKLKIEERDLTWEEQVQWVMKNTDVEWENLYIVEEIAKETTPKRLLTVTYKDEKIEVYE